MPISHGYYPMGFPLFFSHYLTRFHFFLPNFITHFLMDITHLISYYILHYKHIWWILLDPDPYNTTQSIKFISLHILKHYLIHSFLYGKLLYGLNFKINHRPYLCHFHILFKSFQILIFSQLFAHSIVILLLSIFEFKGTTHHHTLCFHLT